MSVYRVFGLAVLLISAGVVAVVGSLNDPVLACPAIEATNQQGQHYRLDGICVAATDQSIDALLDDNWKLSIWTGEQFVPIVAVVDEYRWLGPTCVQLNFLTLGETVSVNVTSQGIGSS